MLWETNSRDDFSIYPIVDHSAPIVWLRWKSKPETPQDREISRADLLASAASRDLTSLFLAANVMDLHTAARGDNVTKLSRLG